MAKVKGVALINRLEILKQEFGEETLNAVLAEMKPENRDALNNMLFSSWYNADVFRDLNQAARAVLGKKNPKISEKIGELTAESSLKGVYSSKLKENNVLMSLNRLPTLWKAFHDTGELELAEQEEKRAVLRISGYPLPHREFCDVLVGWGRRLIELSGGKNVKVTETKCVLDGADCCELTARWD